MSDITPPHTVTSRDATSELILDYDVVAEPVTEFARKRAEEAAASSSNLKFSAEGRRNVYYVNPFTLKVKPDWNYRDMTDPRNADHVRSLVDSIRENGVLEPLSVHNEGGTFYINSGHCRYLAVMNLINSGVDIPRIPIITEDKYSSEDDRIFAHLNRNSGLPPSPLETAREIRKLHNRGFTEGEIARRTGISVSRITQLLELISGATPKIERLITTHAVSPSMAHKVIKEAGSGDAAEQKLEDAVDVARAKGRKRAMPKDLGRQDVVESSGVASSATPGASDDPASLFDTGDSDDNSALAGGTKTATAGRASVDREGTGGGRQGEPKAHGAEETAVLASIFRAARVTFGPHRVSVSVSKTDFETLKMILDVDPASE